MSNGQTTNPFLEALQIRRKLILHIFLGAMLIAAGGAFLTLRYSASAVVALNPHSVPGEGAGVTKNPVELAWSALTDKQILTIIQQFRLNSGMTRLRAQDNVFTYVRSNIMLHDLGSGGSETPAIQVSFIGPERSTAVDVTNAIAQSLAQPQSQPTTASTRQSSGNLPEELEKSRVTLQLLSQTQNESIPQNELQETFRTDAKLEAARQETVVELAALDQQTAQAAASRARAQAQKPTPPSPEAVALMQQIKQAQAHLAQLRQRYTDEYPEVQEARETLATLDGKFSRIHTEKPRPRATAQASVPTADEIGIAAAKDRVLERQQGLDEAIKNNANQARRLRQRIADSKNFAQDYAFEQQRYNALLKQQQLGATEAASGPAPRFIVIQSATNSRADGFGLKPLFWILSVFSALFVACLSAYIAEQFNPADGADATPRSLRSN